MPRVVPYIIMVLVPLAALPFVGVWLLQSMHSTRPRVQPLQDMGAQPKFKAQAGDPLFADSRAMRLPVPGTIAQSHLEEDDHYYRGYYAGQTVVNSQTKKEEPKWYEGYPAQVKITTELVRRGQERFNIYCSVCHGPAGYGDGMIHRRATALQTPGWVQPKNLHEADFVTMPNGRLFNTITLGRNTMQGYGAQISAADRWAIVAYVRALQRSQNAKFSDVPESDRSDLR